MDEYRRSLLLDGVGNLDAVLIGAGAATQAAKDQATLKAMVSAGYLGRLFDWKSLQDWTARIAEQTQAERRARFADYEVLRSAFPYLSALGETLPSGVAGLRGIAPSLQFNLGRAVLEDAAMRTQNPFLRRASAGLRQY